MNQSNSFPIMYSYKQRHLRPASLPWDMVAPHEKRARKNHGDQSLERLAQRGGLDPTEMLAVLEDRGWKKMDVETAATQLMGLLNEYYQWGEDFGPNGDATTPGFFKQKGEGS